MSLSSKSKRIVASVSTLLVCLLLAAAISLPAKAEERVYKVEAAFLYNFLNYITWPGYHAPEDMKHATICIAANDPVLPYLEYIQHKMEQERTLNIEQVQVKDKAAITGCQILLIRSTSGMELSTLLPFANQKGMLLVSTMPDFVERGGMIGLTRDGEHIAIEIDNSQLKQADFQVSSRLLGLAQKVK